MLIRHILPERYRATFVATYVLLRVLLAIGENRVFDGHPPIPLVIAVSVVVAVVMWQVAHRLGWYEPEAEAADLAAAVPAPAVTRPTVSVTSSPAHVAAPRTPFPSPTIGRPVSNQASQLPATRAPRTVRLDLPRWAPSSPAAPLND